MDRPHRIGTRRTARLLAAGAALLAAGGTPPVMAQVSAQRAAPAIQAPVRAQVRAIAPRAASGATLAQTELVAPELVQRADAALLNFNVEAEDWGDRPDLGFTVQDMSGWGSEWSGNKQIFWNPKLPAKAFKWDFSVTGGKILRIWLTAAPDYANLSIRLGCYRNTSGNYYHLLSEHQMYYEGYATSVRRKAVTYPLAADPQCATADMYRLLFVAQQSQGRTFGGIDNITVTR